MVWINVARGSPSEIKHPLAQQKSGTGILFQRIKSDFSFFRPSAASRDRGGDEFGSVEFLDTRGDCERVQVLEEFVTTHAMPNFRARQNVKSSTGKINNRS